MSMVSDIAGYLATAKVGTVNVSIFINHLPDVDGPVISLTQYGGNIPPRKTGIECPGLQVWCRAKTFEDGDAKMKAVFACLHEIGPVTINSKIYKYIQANQSHQYMGQDENDRHEWVMNFIVMKDV